MISSAGVPTVGAFDQAPVVPGTSPMLGRGAWRFDQADHFTIGSNAGTSQVQSPGLPPFVERDAPLTFTNPIADVHWQITHFFDTRRRTGVGEIATP